jgi:hypothetical protein
MCGVGRLAHNPHPRMPPVVPATRLSYDQIKRLINPCHGDPVGIAMAIEVLCPNGHKIICPEDRAGRSARCPRCSEPFRIPEPTHNGQPSSTDALEVPADLAEGDAPRSNGSKADSPSNVNAAADDRRGADAPGSDMALAVSATAEDVDVANSAEVLASWSGLSDLRLVDSDIIKKSQQPPSSAPASASDATTSDSAPEIEDIDIPTQQPADEDMILFLCPSGHKLHGLRRLAGKVGKCPHCDVTFEIPYPFDADDDEADRDELDDTVTEDPLSDFGESGVAEVAAGKQPVFEEPAPLQPPESDTPSRRGLFGAVRATGSSIVGRITGRSGKRKSQSDPAPADPPPAPETPASPPPPPPSPPPPTSTVHPLAELVTRLWSERDHGGVIELHLRGGALLAPDWFDAHHSQGTHGLFASQAADGTVAMTIVPWDEVTRVVVRGVVGLPDGMFE